MAPMKRTASKTLKKAADPIKSRCKLIKEAIEESESCSQSVKDMLSSTLSVTVGALEANRHQFCNRFVKMIGEVLETEHKRLEADVASKETVFNETTPAKASREAALEQAKAEAAAKAETLEAAKQAVTAAGVTLKEAAAALKEAEKAEKEGNASLDATEAKKATLQETQNEFLAPLLDATAEDKVKKAKRVLEVGKTFNFDASLLATAEPVLTKEMSERGSFDATCLEQLTGTFNSAVAALDEQIAAGAAGKAERAAAVGQASSAKTAAEESQANAKAAAQSAKEAKQAADAAEKAASKSLDDFMPDLKKAGDALDEAKDDLKEFTAGALKSFHDLKAVKDGDFIWQIHTGASYYETIDGMKLDRGIIDACRTAMQDGQISLQDAKNVFAEIADGGKETRCERWTVRYCMQEFKWAADARRWLMEELKNVPQEGEAPAKRARVSTVGYYETVDGCKCDRAIIEICKEQGETAISDEVAKNVWAKAADGTKVTDAEKWTVRYCLSAFNFEASASHWLLEQVHQANQPAPTDAA